MPKVIFIFTVSLIMANFSPLIDHFLHPDIAYFDKEHLIEGGAYAFMTAVLIIFMMHIKERKRAEIEALQKAHDELEIRVRERTAELDNLGMELALSLSEVFEALKKVASGDPVVRVDETSEIELIEKLKHMVNMTAENIGEMIDQCHEFAMELAEHFDVFYKVSKGDMSARISGESKIELLKDLKTVANKMIESLDKEITERKRDEQEIRRLNEELELKVEERTRQFLDVQEELVRKGKLAIIGQLAGVVAHELRNHIGVINNAVYFLKTVMPDADETVKEYLNIIKDKVLTSECIVSDLLNFARTKTPQKSLVTAGELITQSLGECKVPENVTVEADIPETLPEIIVDPMQMRQVFMNIIRNAIEVLPDGGTLKIKAGKDKEAGALRISITDTGSGISPENMSKLFQPLFTTKARGMGLGLTVVKNLTEANGGRVKVESELGKGTTFTVILPVEEG